MKYLINDRGFLVNLLAVVFLAIGLVFSSNLFITIGTFAFLGSITNWIAIQMLFHKVPLFYGSGVIERNFDKFKLSLKNLIMQEFFNKKNISSFFKKDSIIDCDKLFDDLVESILDSSMSSFVNMIGGKEALEPLRESVIKKIQNILSDNSNFSGGIEIILDNRLNQLSSKMIKDIISHMIKKHLDWLIFWGGFIGGLIGLVYHIITLNL